MIDWEDFKKLLDKNYKFYDRKNYITSIVLLDRIYNKYQNGDRTLQLYDELMDIIGD
jgi:hypothetical protein